MDFEEPRKRARISDESGNKEGAPSRVQCSVVQKGKGFVQDLMDGSLRFEDLTYEANSKSLEAVVATAEPGVSCWEGRIHAGGKWYYILEGKLELVIKNSSYILEEGDSIYVEPADSHIWRNPTDRTAKALVLSSPPAF